MSRLEELVRKQECDFDIPPSQRAKKKYFGSDLVKMWNQEFKKKCWYIPHFPVISFHVLLGQLPNVKNIKINVGNTAEDCRVHMILVQESGSGKGGGFTFMEEMSEKVSVIFHPTGDLTNSALIGSMKPMNNGSSKHIPGMLDPRYDDGGGIDILASNEASALMDTQSQFYDKRSILALQKAMNRMNTADNIIMKETGVGQQTIKFNTDVSLYLTTFEPERMFQTMTQTGFLQRMIVIYNPISLKDKWKVARKHASLLEEEPDGEKDHTGNIVAGLRYINNMYEGVDSLTLVDDAKDALVNKVLPLIYRPLLDLESNTLNEVKKFTTRYQVMLYKIAWHHAITRLSKKVELQDIAYARKVFIPVYKKLLAYMENAYEPTKKQKVKSQSERSMIENVYKEMSQQAETDSNRPWIRKPYLVSELADRWEVSEEGARQRLEKHIAMFHTDISKHNSIILRLRE